MNNYKNYSLKRLEEWMHDALSCSEATPQEIYDVIKGVVQENYYTYKNETEKCYELLALLNGNGKGHITLGNGFYSPDEDRTNPWYDYFTDPGGNQVKVCDKDDTSPECKGAWNDFWEEYYYPEEHKEDKVVKWQLPVQVDGLTGDCYVNFPDDLLESANLKEGDTIEWIDNKDGSFTMRKVNDTSKNS